MPHITTTTISIYIYCICIHMFIWCMCILLYSILLPIITIININSIKRRRAVDNIFSSLPKIFNRYWDRIMYVYNADNANRINPSPIVQSSMCFLFAMAINQCNNNQHQPVNQTINQSINRPVNQSTKCTLKNIVYQQQLLLLPHLLLLLLLLPLHNSKCNLG